MMNAGGTFEDLLSDLQGFQQAEQADPSDPEPPFQSGLIHAQMGDYAAAVNCYLTALERDPG